MALVQSLERGDLRCDVTAAQTRGGEGELQRLFCGGRLGARVGSHERSHLPILDHLQPGHQRAGELSLRFGRRLVARIVGTGRQHAGAPAFVAAPFRDEISCDPLQVLGDRNGKAAAIAPVLIFGGDRGLCREQALERGQTLDGRALCGKRRRLECGRIALRDQRAELTLHEPARIGPESKCAPGARSPPWGQSAGTRSPPKPAQPDRSPRARRRGARACRYRSHRDRLRAWRRPFGTSRSAGRDTHRRSSWSSRHRVAPRARQRPRRVRTRPKLQDPIRWPALSARPVLVDVNSDLHQPPPDFADLPRMGAEAGKVSPAAPRHSVAPDKCSPTPRAPENILDLVSTKSFSSRH